MGWDWYTVRARRREESDERVTRGTRAVVVKCRLRKEVNAYEE